MKAEIRYEPSKFPDVHRFVILDDEGNPALRFEYDATRRTAEFWLTGGYQPWGVMQALASLVGDCELSTWEPEPDEFLRSKYPVYEPVTS